MFPLPETITVWNSTGNDGLGGVGWSTPATYPARIAHRQKRVTDANGDEIVSTAACYSEGENLTYDSLVLFGESSAIAPPPEARRVRALSQTPSGAGALKKAWFA